MDTIEKYTSTRQKLVNAAGVQPESKFATINGPVKKIHFLEAGSGKPLILLHCGGGHSRKWINIIKLLDSDLEQNLLKQTLNKYLELTKEENEEIDLDDIDF